MRLKLYSQVLIGFFVFCLRCQGAFGQVSVTATAGTTGPTAYINLSSAFTAINGGTHQGVITVSITSSFVDVASAVLNSSGAGSASYTSVTVRPTADGVSMSFPSVTGRGVIELNGADNVTIDGDNPNTGGTNRNLTILNSAANTITFTSCIRLATSTLVLNCDNVIIRNLNLTGSGAGRNTSSFTSEVTTWGVIASGGASTTDATAAPGALASATTTIASGQTVTNLNVTNNNIQNVARGVSVNGAANTVAQGLLINLNNIGNQTVGAADQVTAVGITVNGSDNAIIRQNVVRVEGWIGSSTPNRAINVGMISTTGLANALIERNTVGIINNNDGTWTASGIDITGGANHLIQNNFVGNCLNSQVAGTGAFSTTFGAYGIRIIGGTGHRIAYNSVHFTGAVAGSVSTDLVTCLCVVSTTSTGLDIRNNIFSNQATGGNPSLYNTVLTSIFLPSGASSAMNLTLNNNVYYQGALPHNGIAQVGTTGAAANLYLASAFVQGSTSPAANLRAYTSTLNAAGTNDNASWAYQATPPFVSATNLHINTGAGNASDVSNKAAVIGAITNDFDNDVRSGTTPDIGADEFVTVPPTCVLTCPANIVTSNTANQCGAVVNYAATTGVGSCGTIVSVPASGSFFPVGTTVVTSTSYNTLYQQTGASVVAAGSQNFETANDAFDDQAADDFLVPAGLTWGVTRVTVEGVYFNGVGPAASVNVTFYQNNAGVPGSVIQTFTNVAFTGGPSFVIDLPSTVNLAGGAAGTLYWVSVQANQNFTPAGQWGWNTFGGAPINGEGVWRNPGGGFGNPCINYGGVSSACSVTPGNPNFAFSVYGSSSNNLPCTFTVRVNDTQAPTVTCPANQTVNSAAGSCGANVNLPAPTISDNCPGSTFTYSPASGSFFPVGNTTVTATVTDASGNTATCTFRVTVNDATPPVITCPANITVPNQANQCGAVVNFTVNATDNCATLALTQSSSTAIVALNSVSCNNGVGHTDNSYWRAYQLAQPGNVTITNVQFGIEQATGAGGTQNVNVRLYTSAGAFPGATRTQIATQTFAVPNQSGTIYTATFTTPVVVAGNANLVVELNTPDGRPAGNLFFIGSNPSPETAPSYLSAVDCGVATPTTMAAIGFPNMHIILNVNGFLPVPVVSSPASGSFFPVGNTTVTSTATDPNGNTSTCTFRVTVQDTQAPAITCPGTVTVTTPVGSCVATATYSVTASDNCPGVTTALVSGLPSGATTYPIGTTTNTWRATDAAGNTSTCSFNVVVIDGNLPTITVQPVNRTVCETTNTTFNVTATSASPLNYQWQLFTGGAWVNVTNGGIYSGATTNTLTITGVTTSLNTNSYRVNVIGLCTTVTSGFGTLYVNKLPTITLVASQPPQLLPWDIMSITANTNPSGGTFVWFHDGVAIPGVTGATLSGLTVDDVGTYRAVYTDPNGCVMTSANLVVSALPSTKLFVYPNPNTGQFQVRYYTPTSGIPLNLMIYDSKGAMIYQSKTLSTLPYTSLQVDLSGRPSGTYMVDLRDSNGNPLGSRKVLIWPR